MEKKSFFKSKAKAFIGTVLGLAVTLSLFASALTAFAATPRFNFLEGDWEMLQGANRTTNQTTWADPVSGTAGDTFAGIIYYHNGVVDSTAHNTRIKVNIPAETSDKTAVITGSVGADDAETVTDTIVNGQIVGRSGLTINLNEESTLALVPGSVKWFPNFTGSTTSQPLPNGQTGDEITSANGINIGDIQGCWDFLGYATFLVSTRSVAQPNVAVEKTVRNVTANEANFVEQNKAKPGETLEYRVIARNTGNAVGNNLVFIDTIPAGTTYVAGSTTVGGQAVGNDIVSSDGLTVASVAAGGSVEIRFRVTVNHSVANGTELLNTVKLHFNKAVLTDTAKTIVEFTTTTPPVGGELPETGAGNVLLTFLVSLSGILGGVFVKSRKTLASKSW